MEKKKYLDYEGFKLYHDELVSELRDQVFDPQRLFEDQTELVDIANWQFEYGKVRGLKKGLIVTVANKFWQLIDPVTFEKRLTRVGETIDEKSVLDPEVLGWKVVGSTTEFNVDGHTLKLMK